MVRKKSSVALNGLRIVAFDRAPYECPGRYSGKSENKSGRTGLAQKAQKKEKK